MKKFLALLCTMILLLTSVPASADGLGDLFSGIFGGDTTEEAEEETHYFEGDTVAVEVNGIKLNVHTNFKTIMDEYDAFFDEYVELMKNPDDMLKYASFMTQYAETMAALSALEEDEDMTNDDLAYYTYIMSNISIKQMTVQ
jgi:hypothetical protein